MSVDGSGSERLVYRRLREWEELNGNPNDEIPFVVVNRVYAASSERDMSKGAQMFFMFAPGVVEIALWYLVFHGYPQLSAVAMLGAPIALGATLGAASART